MSVAALRERRLRPSIFRSSPLSLTAALISRNFSLDERFYSRKICPIADGECVDPALLDLGMLAAGKSALDRAELRDAKLFGEIRVERDLRTPGIYEEGDFVAAVYAHVDHRQRIGF